ncbi:Uncharacterized UPF0721 integral membrane protein [hydrothermal vent metagenome]|uniref:Uncharacterized UPF0721 integral membrane protein n=1 Tax=hydrothermal vent metagenome TaxID=652676 RepID=A0A3B0Z8Z8_9ZZZZ
MFDLLLIYLALGVLAGTTAGLLGLGGGAVIVPVLYMVFSAQGVSADLVMHMAIGTSLATIIFTSITSTYTHHQQRAVQWQLVRSLLPAIVLGIVAGSFLADQLNSVTLRVFFGLFELLIAAQMFFTLIPPSQQIKQKQWLYTLAGSVTGVISALLGIGGGSVMVPFLHWSGVNMRKAIATSAACGFPIGLFGALSFILLGQGDNQQQPWSLGYIYLPALLGILLTSIVSARLSARLAHRLPLPLLKKIFAIVLALVGLKMIFG